MFPDIAVAVTSVENSLNHCLNWAKPKNKYEVGKKVFLKDKITVLGAGLVWVNS